MTNILDIKMRENDAAAETVRDYLKALLRGVWEDLECFSGKRPFGNSSWEYELYYALADAEVITAELNEEGEFIDFDEDGARKLIFEAIESL
jgi:hypothetical protein